MKLPIIVVNFKLYENATGENAVELAKIHQRVAEETGASIAIAVNALDLEKVVNAVEIPVLIQHMDPVEYGSHTGHILPDLVKEKGASGVLLNHAECLMEDHNIKKVVEIARELDLFTIVCAHSPEDAGKMLEYGPDLIAVEPPELIGGDISISKANPKIIEDAVKMAGEDRLIVGAGVKNSEDVQIALALGAQGVLLASGVTRVEDPYSCLMDLVAGLGEFR